VLVTSRYHFNVIRAPGTNISVAFLFYEKYFSHQKHRNDAFERYKREQKLEKKKKSFAVLNNADWITFESVLSGKKKFLNFSRNHKTDGILIIKMPLYFT
jgi:hypothetical protein